MHVRLLPGIAALTLLAALFLLQPRNGWGADDEPDYLFRVQLDNITLAEDVAAFEQDNEIFLPLCEMSSLTSIAIRMQGNDRATGFILDEERTFLLDLSSATVTISGTAQPISPRRVVSRGSDIYVAAPLLAEWLPMNLKVSREEQVVTIEAREPLPMQRMMQRRVQPRTPPPSRLDGDNAYPERTAPYLPLRVPFIDLSLHVESTGVRDAGPVQTEGKYSLLATGDVAWMNASLFALATDDRFDRFDISLGRTSPDGDLIGALRATHYRVGTVQLPAMKGVSRVTSPLYGFFVTNRPPTMTSRFATHDIQGLLPAGWDAELYYNGIPVRYQPPSDEGSYLFDSLPLQYGLNDFRLVLHGPHGELKEERQRFLLDGLMVQPGKVIYSCGANHDLVGETESSNGTFLMDIGLTKRLSAFAGVAATDTPAAETRGYLSLGMRGTLGSSFSALDLTRASDGGTALFFTVTSHAIPGIYLFFDEALLHRFVSDIFPLDANPFISLTQLRVEGSLPFEIRVPYTVEATAGVRRQGEFVPGASFRITGGVAGVSLSNQLGVRYDADRVALKNVLQIGTSLKDINVRGQVATSLAPDVRMDMVQLAVSKNIGSGLQVSGAVTHEVMLDLYNFTGNISKRSGSFSFAVGAGWETTGAFKISVDLSFGLGMDPVTARPILSAAPMAASGVARIMAFIDKNENGVHDEGEPALKGVKFTFGGAVLSEQTGNDGVVIVTQLQAGVPIELAVLEDSVTDPYISPSVPGYRFTPRAGVAGSYPFPFLPSGEIDGVVKARGIHGDTPLAGIYLLLTDKSGKQVAQTQSDQSGYYLFKGVRKGEYRIRLRESEEVRLGVRQETTPDVIMPPGGDLVGGADVLLVTTKASYHSM